MRYYRVSEKFGKTHLCVEAGDGLLTSLSSINERVGEFRDLLDASDITGNSVDAIARHLLKQGRGKEFELAQLIDWSISETGDARIIKPLEPDEMWAGGLGNMIMTPENLADAPEGVRLAYNTPEITTNFYKGTSHRLAGPFDRVGIRADTEHTIAEGELVLVIYKGKLAGFSTGNEVAGGLGARSANWLVPSKVFTGCASLGPCIATLESIPDPMSLALELVQYRGGKEIARSEVPARLKRPPEEIVASTVAHDSPPPPPPRFGHSVHRRIRCDTRLPTPGGRCRADHHGGSRIRPEHCRGRLMGAVRSPHSIRLHPVGFGNSVLTSMRES